MNLVFPIQINILDFIFKGIIIGVIASAPMGPVGILCIQRTLNKGRWFGFVTGVGAAFSDIVYALFTGLGMSFVMDIVNNAQNKFYLQIFGGLLLLVFGVYCFKSNPTKNMHQSSKRQGTLWHNAITAFFVTLSNPPISSGISGTTKANWAKVAMKRNTMSGLESVTKKAVMALCQSVPCLLLL